MAVPISSSTRVIPDHRAEYYRRSFWEKKPDWNRDRNRNRDRKPYPMKWSRTGSVPREGSKEASESPRKRSRDREVTVNPEGSPEDSPSKMARLGWGQGLAKYEMLKVGPSDDSKQESVVPDMFKENTVDAAKDAINHEKEFDSETCIGKETSFGTARDSFTQEPSFAVDSDLPADEQQYGNFIFGISFLSFILSRSRRVKIICFTASLILHNCKICRRVTLSILI